MKNPLNKVVKKLVKKPDLKTRVYSELAKVQKNLEKELKVVSNRFNKEVQALKKTGKKIEIEKELLVLKKKGDSLLTEMKKTTDKVMAEVKKDYHLVLADVKKRLQ